MQSSPDQPSSGAWLGLPPDEKRPVSRGARYRCIFLMLLYWAVLSAIPQGADRLAEIGTNLPLWMGALELTPFLLVPAFLFLAVRTGAQWRALMITVYAGLFLNLLMNMALPSGAMWGDLPAAGPYGTLVWARRGPPGMAGHAAPFSPILGSRHLCLPLRQRNPAPASPAGPGLVVPALRGPREHGHGGVCGHPGASGHHRPRPRLHAPGGKKSLPANQGLKIQGGHSTEETAAPGPADTTRRKTSRCHPLFPDYFKNIYGTSLFPGSGRGPSPVF